MRSILVCLLLSLVLVGCQSAAFHEGDYVGQGLETHFQQPPVPGVIISTHEDGSQTVLPLEPTPAPAPVTAKAPAPAAPAPNPSPVVQVTVVPTQPGVVTSYSITPEKKKGDFVGASRMVTWAGEAPGTVVEKVVTQKQKIDHKALPAVSVTKDGVNAQAGGGSSEDQSGLSFFQRAGVWLSDLFKGWSMWLLVAGIAVAAFFILPIFLPVLKPIFASIASGLHAAWDFLAGEFSKLLAWIKSIHTKPVTPTVTAALPKDPTPPSTTGVIK
jgi:hypothetical protein